MLEDLLNHCRLVDEADDGHLSLTLRAREWVCLIDLSYEVGPGSSAFISRAGPDSALIAPRPRFLLDPLFQSQ